MCFEYNFSAIHDQGCENFCWAYAIPTMLRASIRSAVKKYNIKNGLEILDDPNHHKMMRKELTMNIFPFGDDGTDPSMVIKLVCIMGFSYLSVTQKIKRTNFIAHNTFMSTRCWASPTSHSNLDFEKI